ncbi:hypothetical protein F4859DRAFT_283514 [Xylaria cf. heliscus]|nr:hypothetical protein F4859DRAFT_283514 [Xylaria cf. heliscus]
MSGIEVVGIALGILPLIISALENYQNGETVVSTWRRHERVIQSLARNLKTEQGCLRNTCETLLGGIVSPTTVGSMLEEFDGPLWKDKDTNERIERRLDHMYNNFYGIVKDMIETMKELDSKLGLNTQSQSEWHTGSTTIMRASLVIKRSSYEKTLQYLISRNQRLATIVVDSVRLEPSRGKRSRGIFLKLFGRISSSIYNALQLGLCGTCQQKHGVSLQLPMPPLTWRGDEKAIIKKLDFRVVLSHYVMGPATIHTANWNWKEVKLQVDIPLATLKRGISPPNNPLVKVIDGRRVLKRVKILVGGDPQIADAQSISNFPAETGHSLLLEPPLKPITDKLCQALGIESSGPKACGYVTDPSVREHGRFSVVHINDIRDNCELTFISIRDVMQAPTPGRQKWDPPSLPQKLVLASTIASGILQLQNTPWLSMVMTSRTLYLERFDIDTVSFDRAYISRTAPENPCPHNPSRPDQCQNSATITTLAERFGNELMWALFVLLIEVILWRTMDDILSEGSAANMVGASPREIFDCAAEPGFKIVQGLLSRVTLVAGQEYCCAVETCLKLAFGFPNLDLGREEVRHQVYVDIITPIEESCQNSKSVKISRGGVDITN